MRFTRFLAPALVAAGLAGCVDEPVATIPAGDARVVFAAGFSFSGMDAGLPIEAVRLTPTFYPNGGAAGQPRRVTVDSNDDEFEVDAIVDIGDQDSADIRILVELLSTASGDDVVEWSGEVGPIRVIADETVTAHDLVEMIRGPIENRGVFAVDAFGPSFMTLGSSHPAHAFASSEGTGEPTIIWSSSDPNVVEVEPAVGDSVELFAHAPGSVWIFAGAGTQTDSFQVFVDDVEAGPVEIVQVAPDSTVMVPNSSRTLFAFATDSLGIPVSTTFTWSSLDTDIATVSSTGVVTAHSLGFTQIVVAAANGVADTADVDVQPLPPGVDIVFVGGTIGAEFDWFTADNWSPARVPTATDVVYIPTGTFFVELDGDTEIGGFIADSLGGYNIDIHESTLTINGDLIAPFIFGDSTAHVVMAGTSAILSTIAVPSLTILGDVEVVENAYVYGDLTVDGGTGGAFFDIGTAIVVADGDFNAQNATVRLVEDDTTFESGGLFISGSATIAGGDWTSTIEDGTSIDVGRDFTVTGACGVFAPAGGNVSLISDTASISMTCATANGNRFFDLFVYEETGVGRMLELQSDIVVANELYLDGGDGTIVHGNGHTLQARLGSAYWTTFDNTFVEVVNVDEFDYFSTDSIVFTGMTGATRPQVQYTHPGDSCSSCYGPVDVQFDPTSSGPYIEVIDNVANGDSVVLYMQHNPGDGPARTVTSGEAVVHWADVPYHLLYWSGSGQTGPQHQPLPDSLVAQLVDFNFSGVSGATVDWIVTDGNGSVSPTTSTTDSLGYAMTQFTLGDSINVTQQVIAVTPALPGDTVFFDAYPFFGSPPAGAAVRVTNDDRTERPTMRAAPPMRPLDERRTMPQPPARPERPTTGRER